MRATSLSGIVDSLKINITKQAIDKHFNKQSHVFLQEILSIFLNICVVRKLDSKYLKAFSKVIICDSTWIRLHQELKNVFSSFGGSCSDAFCKIQLSYNLLINQIDSIKLTKCTKNDSTYSVELLKTLKKGSLLLVDLGYFSSSFFSKVHANGAYFISRLKSGVKIFNPTTQKEIDILKLLKSTKVPNFEFDILLGINQGLALPVRLIGSRVPKTIAEQRRRKCKNKDGRIKNPKKITLELCDWTLIITNTQAELIPAEQVYILYGLRWQIEIIFKQLKSILQIHKINTRNKDRVRTEIYGKLIAATIITKMHGSLNIQSWNESKEEISIDKFFKRIQERMFTFVLFIQDSLSKAIKFLMSEVNKFIRNCIKFKQRSRMTSLQSLHSFPRLDFQKIFLPLS